MKLLKICTALGIILLTGCSNGTTTSDANQVAKVHEKNLEDKFALNFDALEAKFSKEFKILGSKTDKTLDYIAEFKKDIDPNNPVFKKEIHELYNFNQVYVFDYNQLVENGMAEKMRPFPLKEGDYFVQINPNPGISDEHGIEEFALLYRKINGDWIAIAGTQ